MTGSASRSDRLDRVRSLYPIRVAFALLAAWYLTAYLRAPGTFLLLDHVDLAIHEAGHVVFSPFGEFVGVAGGTLLQLLLPAAFVAYFFRTGQVYAAFITLFWVAQSLHNVSVYIADARAQLLPLVGGEYVIHDWAYMLSRLRLLTDDRTIASLVRAAAALLWFAAVGGALWHSRRPNTGDEAATVPLARPALDGSAGTR